MILRKLITGLTVSVLLANLAIADTSPSYIIDNSELNAGLEVQTSSSFQMNDTIVGFVEGGVNTSTSFQLGSGLVYLETLCGNSIIEFGESCDDGNTTSGDGCSSVCQTEILPGAVCGNGLLEGSETCDDGNTNSGDGCSAVCQVEGGGGGGGGGGAGGSPTGNLCGNGIKQGTEQCDDGNGINGDGCSAICKLETSFCGDGIKAANEQCDDGNSLSGDGCSLACLLETIDDQDGDGISDTVDGFEDTDGDGIPNYLDTDSDNDSIPDSVEGTNDQDQDGVANFLDLDSDNDRIEDSTEGTIDTDSDGTSNYLDTNSDGDQALDIAEGLGDVDNDGVLNYVDPDDGLKPAADEEEEEVEEGKRVIKLKSRPEKRVGGDRNLGLPSRVDFYNRTLGRTVFVAYVNMSSIGWVGVETDELPDGIYDISFKGLSHLTVVARNVRIDASVEVIDFSFGDQVILVAGDVHESKDNFINGLDIAATTQVIYSNDINADLNRDGIVNALDLSIVVGNLYKSGEPL